MFYSLGRRLLRINENLRRLGTTPREFPTTLHLGPCPCCGSTNLFQRDVLWDDLVDIWSLSPKEIVYINRQQGFRCQNCGSRLRSMALGAWFTHYLGGRLPLATEIDLRADECDLAILEVNEAGQLTQFLSRLRGHVLGQYPELDIQDIRFADNTFDVVIHSDTLEHVPDPLRALSECCRIVKPGGVCAFTVPTVVGRPTRDTVISLPSYHGHAGVRSDDLRVRTEFGDDVWKMVVAAGFREYRLFSLEYPAALVHCGVK